LAELRFTASHYVAKIEKNGVRTETKKQA